MAWFWGTPSGARGAFLALSSGAHPAGLGGLLRDAREQTLLGSMRANGLPRCPILRPVTLPVVTLTHWPSAETLCPLLKPLAGFAQMSDYPGQSTVHRSTPELLLCVLSELESEKAKASCPPLPLGSWGAGQACCSELQFLRLIWGSRQFWADVPAGSWGREGVGDPPAEMTQWKTEPRAPPHLSRLLQPGSV